MQTWKTRFCRIAAMVCALALCASLLPAGALANNTDSNESPSSQVVTATEPAEEEKTEETGTETEQPAEEAETEETVEEETQPYKHRRWHCSDRGTEFCCYVAGYAEYRQCRHRLKQAKTLDLTNGTVDIGDIVYTEGGPQTTDVQIYLNYSPLCEFKNLRIDCTGDHTNNFDMQLGEGLLFL